MSVAGWLAASIVYGSMVPESSYNYFKFQNWKE